MDLDPRGQDWQDLALRFAAFQDGVSSCIVGTSRLDHLEDNLRILQKGPLTVEHAAKLQATFGLHGTDWRGKV